MEQDGVVSVAPCTVTSQVLTFTRCTSHSLLAECIDWLPRREMELNRRALDRKSGAADREDAAVAASTLEAKVRDEASVKLFTVA
ncbi:unnamed protein product [Lampetra planeri]